MSALSGPRSRRWLVAGLLVLSCALKAAFDPGPCSRERRCDSQFYEHVAAEVAEGKGLRTRVSLYHQGLRALPSPTTVYPAWPLLLGYGSKLLGAPAAVAILPPVLYGISLLLLFQLAERLGAGFRGDRLVPVGIIAVTLLGTNRIFFRYTTEPYTEGLAFCFLLGSLLALERSVARTSLSLALLAGALSGAAYLTRFQMVVLGLAIPLALSVAGVGNRKWFLHAATAMLGCALAVAPYVLFLASFVQDFNPAVLIDFSSYTETPSLGKYVGGGTGSMGAKKPLLETLAHGMLVSFSPAHGRSYPGSFGPVAYLVPIALGHAVVRRDNWRALFRHATQAESIVWVAAVFTAAGLLVPIHLVRGMFDWLFGHRQGLGFVLLVFASLGYVAVHAGRVLRVLAALLTLGSILYGFGRIIAMVVTETRPRAPAEMRRLGGWLDSHASAGAVLAIKPHSLLPLTRRATFHEAFCEQAPAHTKRMLETLQLRYVLVHPEDRECRFLDGLADDLVPEEAFGVGSRRVEVLAFRGARRR